MDQQQLTLLFRTTGILFLVSLGVFLYYFLLKKGGRFKTIKQVSFITAILCMATLFTIIIYTANTDFSVQALKNANNKDVTADMIDQAKENFIFQDVQAAVGIFVHLVIILSITAAYWYMWRRSRKLPPGKHTNGYKLVLLLGLAFVAGFAGYAMYQCVTDKDFREQIYFKTYAGYFVGNIFIMLLASIVSAAGMPDDEEDSAKGSQVL
jgi:hypothetical protein